MTVTVALRSEQSDPLAWSQVDGNFSGLATQVNINTGDIAAVTATANTAATEASEALTQIAALDVSTTVDWFASSTFYESLPVGAKGFFTPGTTTTLVLSNAYGTTSNVQPDFDGLIQGLEQFTLSSTSIIFDSAIPVGVENVHVKGGGILVANVPSNGSVGVPQLAADTLSFFTQVSTLASAVGSALVGFSKPGPLVTIQQQLNMLYYGIASVRDTQFAGGAIGNGSNNDGPAIQAALNSLIPGAFLDFGSGNFLIEEGLTCSTNDIHLLGSGNNTAYGCCIIGAGASGYTLLTLSGNENVVDGLGFLGNPSILVNGAGATRSAILFTGDSGANIDGTVIDCAFLSCNGCITTTGRNLNIYDNLFSNSRVCIDVLPATTGQNRDFIINRNRFQEIGDVAGSTFCINFPASSSIFESQIQNNFYDGVGYGLFLYGACNNLMVQGNRITTSQYQWIDISGNNIKIDGNSFLGNATGTGAGIEVGPGSNISITNNFLGNASYQGIVTTGIAGFQISGNTISNASSESGGSYDAIQLDSASSNGEVVNNHIYNQSTSFARYGISGNPTNTKAFGNTFLNCASGNVNSTTLYNTTPTPYGQAVEGSNGTLRSSGTKYLTIGSSASVDVAYVDFDSVYGSCLAELNVSAMGSSGTVQWVVAKRMIAFLNGSPSFTTIGTDSTQDFTVAFTYVGTSPNRIKITVTNAISATVYGGTCVDLKGGGSNATGAAGATLTMI